MTFKLERIFNTLSYQVFIPNFEMSKYFLLVEGARYKYIYILFPCAVRILKLEETNLVHDIICYFGFILMVNLNTVNNNSLFRASR